MSEALPFVGAAVGSFFGAPQVGWMIGSLASSAFQPTQKTHGPRLSDLKVSGMAYGQPIPWIQGTHRTAGQLIYSSDRREIATTTRQGKGGGKSRNTTYTYEVDCLFLLSSNELEGLLRVWDNGKLVYTTDDSASDGSLIASSETELWRRITFYGGNPAQLPDPTYEAAVGAGNAPAYRGMCTVFIEGLQLGQSGQFPNLSFEVGTNLTPAIMENYQDFGPSNYPVRADYRSQPSSVGFLGVVQNEGRFGPAGQFSGNFVVPRQGLGIGTTPNVPALGRGEFTAQFWLKNPQGSYASARGMILASGISNGSTNGFRVLFNENGALVFDVRGGGGPTGVTSASAIFPLNTQFHLAVIRVADTITGYIDGVPVLTADLPPGYVMQATEIWEIGGSQAAQANWQGYMSDVALSSTARWNGPFVPPDTPHVPDQFTLFWIPFYRVDTVQRGNETVRTVVERLCARAGLPAGTYDATALDAITKPVRALAVSQVGGTRASLEMLGQTFFFQVVCTDKLYFVPRAQSVVATIPFSDLGTAQAMEDSPEPFALRQRNDIEVPAQEAITYANVSDDYQSDTQYSDRLLSSQTNTGTTEVALGFTPSEAKAIADAKVTDGAISVWSAPISLSRKYARLTPGDSVLVAADDGSVYRVLLCRQTQSNGLIGFETRLEDSTVFTQAGVTGGDYSPQTEVVSIPGTYLLMLDIPLLRDADDGIGLYAAARGLAPGWPGTEVFESTDDLSYTSRATVTESAVLGVTTTALGGWTGKNVFDESNTVTVNVGAGSLSSATRDEILASKTLNAALVGDEIVQFRTASMLSPGVYLLSSFLRGRRGTDRIMTGHAAGERFVLLQPTGMRRIDQGNADLSALRYFRGVSLGRSLSTGARQEVVNTGVSMRPFNPVDARANRATTDTVITWRRRTRVETRFLGPLGSSVPLGEAFEAYQVDIYTTSGFTTVVRTLTSLTPSVTYTSAQQVADFGGNQTVLYVRIYQMSETVGRGFPLQATI